MPCKTDLKRITDALLEPADDFISIHKATEDLYQLFLQVTAIDWKKPEHSEALLLPDGKAIGPAWAAFCIKDIYRTKRFLRGIYLAIRDMQEKNPGKPVRVLYAGTGPFATLAIPLTTVFKPEEVQFTLLEINPESIRILQQVIEVFEAGAFVRNLLECDATCYQADPDYLFQIMVVEVMQNALQHEPQLAITLNLAPQLAETGIFIPERITVEAGLLDPKKDMERMLNLDGFDPDYYRILQTLIELDKYSAAQLAALLKTAHQPGELPEISVDIPFDMPLSFKQLSLFTTIQVYQTEQLVLGQSALNNPQKIMRLDLQNEPMRKIGFRYRIGEDPGFEWRVLKE